MYLVQILEKKLSDKWIKSPSIEKLQSFEFQLYSPEWCAIDCVPEKGALFEVHYGNDTGRQDDDDSDRVACVMIAPDAQKALMCSVMLMNLRRIYYRDMPEGCVLLWCESNKRADNFFSCSALK